MSSFSIVVLLAVAAAIGGIVWVIYAVRRKEEYTREKFAFVALAAYMGLLGTVVSSIADKESPWTTIANFIRTLRGLPKEASEPRPTDHILLVVVAGIAAVLIYRIYREWGGAISSEEHRRGQVRGKPVLLRDGLDEARRLIHRGARELHRPKATEATFGQLPIPSDTLAWHLQALDLVTLRNPSYRFNLDHDYYPEAHCWIGEYPQIKQTIAVLCAQREPTEVEIAQFLTYVHRVKGRHLEPSELEAIVALREGVSATVKSGDVTVQIQTERTFLDDLVDFADYFDQIERRVEKEALADSEKTLKMVYAPSRCVSEADKKQYDNVELALSEWLGESGQRQLALLGEYGQGKSTTALMFAYHLIGNSNRRPPRVPILVELRGRSPRNTTPEGLIAEWAYHFSRVTPKAVMKLIIAGRAIVILESFDEMALAGDAQGRYAHFQTLWGFCYPKSKVLFTGRPNYFLDNRELKSALKIEQSVAAGAYCDSLRLEPFSLGQMESALRSYPPSTRSEIITLAKSNPKFYELASRGSLLYAIGELWHRKGGLAQHGKNINSAVVVGKFIRSTHERQTAKVHDLRSKGGSRKRLLDFMILNSAEREFFMSAIASYMAVTGLPNQIASAQLQLVVETLYHKLPDEISTRVSPASQETNVPLRQRLEGADHVLESIITDVRSCGLLVSDPSKPGSYKFAHKSFMEYLYSEVVAGQYLNQNPEKNNSIAGSSIYGDREWEPTWVLVKIPETLAFFAEILANEVDSNILKAVGAKVFNHVIFSGPGRRTLFASLDLLSTVSILLVSAQVSLGGKLSSAALLSNPITRKQLMYLACCAAAGTPVGPTLSPVSRTINKAGTAWLEMNIPHLASSDSTDRTVDSCA